MDIKEFFEYSSEMEQRKTRTKMYEVIKDGTDFVKRTWITNE